MKLSNILITVSLVSMSAGAALGAPKFECQDATGKAVDGVTSKKECTKPNKWTRAKKEKKGAPAGDTKTSAPAGGAESAPAGGAEAPAK